jgi:GTPase involved in cell partitioning and DNA repair
VRKEIKKFGHGLSDKKMLIAANKIDLDHERSAFKQFLKQLKKDEAKLVYPISAVTREGLPALIAAIDRLLHSD